MHVTVAVLTGRPSWVVNWLIEQIIYASGKNLRPLLPVQPEGRHADYWRWAHTNSRVNVASGTSPILFESISRCVFPQYDFMYTWVLWSPICCPLLHAPLDIQLFATVSSSFYICIYTCIYMYICHMYMYTTLSLYICIYIYICSRLLRIIRHRVIFFFAKSKLGILVCKTFFKLEVLKTRVQKTTSSQWIFLTLGGQTHDLCDSGPSGRPLVATFMICRIAVILVRFRYEQVLPFWSKNWAINNDTF